MAEERANQSSTQLFNALTAEMPVTELMSPCNGTLNDKIIGSTDISYPSDTVDYFMDICEEGFYVSDNGEEFHTIKFDSGASACMSGVSDRIRAVRNLRNSSNGVVINGFNGMTSRATSEGINSDELKEYYVSSMPKDLTLLCAYDYASQGAAILTKNGGYVFQLTAEELEGLENYLSRFPIWKQLKVRRRTYEVIDQSNDGSCVANHACELISSSAEDEINVVDAITVEDAYSGRANRFFNTGFYTSNQHDQVLAMLLTGFSLQDLKLQVKHKSLDGMPPAISEQMLHSFEHRHGTRPDIVTLALPVSRPNRTGLSTAPETLIRPGQRVECDVAEPDYNEKRAETDKKAKKLRSLGQAVAVALAVDCWSGFLLVHLLQKISNSLEYIKYFVKRFKRNNHPIKVFAADSGVVSQSKFQVFEPEVEAYLLSEGVQTVERVEPHNHQRGGATVESMIRRVKDLARLAICYILRNPSFSTFGFDEEDIKRLWGELYIWAATVINLKPCPHKPEITRYEAFYGIKPNMQNIRILPIFSVVTVAFDQTNADAVGNNQRYSRIGLYVGPSLKTPMAIRVAVKAPKGSVQVIVTSKYTPATDGAGLNIYENVRRGFQQMMVVPTQIIPIPNINQNVVVEDVANDEENNMRDSTPVGQDQSAIAPLPLLSQRPSDTSTLVSSDFLSQYDQPATTSDVSSGPQRKRKQSKQNQQSVTPVIYSSDVRDIDETPRDAGVQQGHEHPKRKKKKTKSKKKLIDQASPSEISQTLSQNNNHQQRDSNRKTTTIRSVSNEVLEDDPYRKQYSNSRSRSTTPSKVIRAASPNSKVQPLRRSQRRKAAGNRARSVSGYFADWIMHQHEAYYLSFVDGQIYRVEELTDHDAEMAKEALIQNDKSNTCFAEDEQEIGYKAVTDNVPRNFPAALQDPKWGAPARKELNTLFETKAIVQIDRDIALELIKAKEADLVILFPVYEEKIKEGNLVYKVRLVGDGRTHYSALNTYAATPSREELLIMLHIAAMMGWTYYHVDEVRAFLNAKYKGGNQRVFTKFKGDSTMYEVLGALYGLKTSPRDYQQTVIARLKSMGFLQLQLCTCIFIFRRGPDVVLIYDYVDDFIITGNNKDLVLEKISEIRGQTTTTDPIEDADKILGMEITRCRDSKVIHLTMKGKIEEVCKRFEVDMTKIRHTPMPKYGYILREDEFEKKLTSAEDKRFLSKKEIKVYLGIVGSLVWISGIRMDILFATMFLSWATKQPKVHHMKMAKCVLAYLNFTKDIPLVIGGVPSDGVDTCQLIGYSDASLGTGPKGRSIKAHMFKLGSDAGAITAKCNTTISVYTSSFEAELEGATSGMKTALRLMNILDELNITSYGRVSTLYNDNEAMLNFIRGDGMAKGIRHVELRQYYIREKYLEGRVLVTYMAGQVIPADQMTKIGSKEQFIMFRRDVMGLKLWKDMQVKFDTFDEDGEDERLVANMDVVA